MILLDILIIIIVFFILFEIFIYVLCIFTNKKFQWLIIGKDMKPILSQKGLDKFLRHGYDFELGWIRKPNTSNVEFGKYAQTEWHTDKFGSRLNPTFDNDSSLASCYGDSFTFCRQVNDDQTWEHYLSKFFSSNVKNFGVGNYGVDQAFLRLKREYDKNKTKIVIMGIVPDTISRIMSIWKHYYEYGNTFAFKPKFILHDDELSLLSNPINEFKKYSQYYRSLEFVKQHDYFYLKKFKKELINFPYSITIFKNPKRNFYIIFWIILKLILDTLNKSSQKFISKPMDLIMKINLQWRVDLYAKNEPTTIFKKIIENYVLFSQKKQFIPILIFLPQKDDLIFIKNNFHFYSSFLNQLKGLNDLFVIDFTPFLINEPNLDLLYSDDNEYGGHMSALGNEKIASILYDKIDEWKLLS